MASGFRPFYVQLLNTRTRQAIDDDAGVCNVLVAGSPVEVTIYSDAAGQVTASNPLTFTNGVVSFWTADTVTSVDLSIMTSTGFAAFVTGLEESQHRVDINPEARTQTLVVPFAPSNNVETDTGFDFPANCLLSPYGTHLRVITVDATEDINVGILSSESGGDADGFIAIGSVATAGIVNLIPQITGGATIDYVSANFVGALLATSIVGADAVATVGGWTPKLYRTDGTAKSITYTGSTGSDTAAGYIYFTYTKLT